MPLTLAAVMAGHAIAWRRRSTASRRSAPDRCAPSRDRGASGTVPTMGLFRRAPTNDAEIEQLEPRPSLREALEQHGRRRQAGGQLGRSADARRLARPEPTRLDELAAKLAALDARVTSVSTELANQLTELGQRHRRPRRPAAGDGADAAARRRAPRRPGPPRQRAGPLPDRVPRGPRPARRASSSARPARCEPPDQRLDSSGGQPPSAGGVEQRQRLVDERLGLVDLRLVLAEVAGGERGVGFVEQLAGLRPAARPASRRSSPVSGGGVSSSPVSGSSARRRRGRRGRPRSRGTACPAPRRATRRTPPGRRRRR